MRRYGWDYDRGYRGRGVEPRGFYGRGYHRGWGMAGLNDAFLHGPPPEERGYDHAIHRAPRRRAGYDEGWLRPRGGAWGARPGPGPLWRGGYDRHWW